MPTPPLRTSNDESGVIWSARSKVPSAPNGYLVETQSGDVNLAAADNVIEALFKADSMPTDLLNTVDDVTEDVNFSKQISSTSTEDSSFMMNTDEGVTASCSNSAYRSGNSPQGGMEPQKNSGAFYFDPFSGKGETQVSNVLMFELTENFDDLQHDDSNFGLDQDTLGQIAHQFNKDERIPDTLKYELTEDLPPFDGSNDWDDSEFGFSDQQLETLWKRFGVRMGSKASDATPRKGVNEFKTPETKALAIVEEEDEVTSPCTKALQSVEDALDNIGTASVVDSIGHETIEQFIGEAVPELPRSGIYRAWMVSTHNFEGIDWYLFRVSDRGANRFYMKTFSDFEELGEELEKVSQHGRHPQLPRLTGQDYFGVWRFFGGTDFDEQRTKGLRTYVSELMSRTLSPAQEQTVRLFFGPNARGRIMPPSGPVHRGMIC